MADSAAEIRRVASVNVINSFMNHGNVVWFARCAIRRGSGVGTTHDAVARWT